MAQEFIFISNGLLLPCSGGVIHRLALWPLRCRPRLILLRAIQRMTTAMNKAPFLYRQVNAVRDILSQFHCDSCPFFPPLLFVCWGGAGLSCRDHKPIRPTLRLGRAQCLFFPACNVNHISILSSLGGLLLSGATHGTRGGADMHPST